MAQAAYCDNPIVSGYPGYIISGNQRKKCDTHFRVWLQIARLFDDVELSEIEKAMYAIELSGIDHGDTLADLKGIQLFLACGLEIRDDKPTARAFDYDLDAARIIASFQAEYGIDLTARETCLHWWRFNDLLRGLSESSVLMKAIEIRTMSLPDGNDKYTKERRDAIIKAKKALAIPAKTAAEKAAKDAALWGE